MFTRIFIQRFIAPPKKEVEKEAEVKERIEKRKAKQQELATNNKLLKRKKKTKKTRSKKKCNGLAELNAEFKNIKKPKSRPKKCLKLF